MVTSVLSNWVAMVVTGGISFFLIPVLVRGLGDFYYGMWVFVGAALDYCGLLDLGIRTTLQRYVGRLKGTEERQALNETVSTALLISLVVGALVILVTTALMFGLAPAMHLQGPDAMVLRWLVFSLGWSVAILFPTRVLGAFLIGLQRFDYYNAASIAAVVVRAGLIVVALRAGYGAIGVGMMALASSLLWLVLNCLLVRLADPAAALSLRHAGLARVRELFGFGIYASLASVGDYLRFYTSSVVIGRVLTIALVTPYSMAARLMEYFKAAVLGLAGPFMPQMSALEGQNRPAQLRDLFLRGTRATALLSVLLAGLLILDGKALLQLWLGPRFLPVYPLLVVLSLGCLVDWSQYPSCQALFAKGRHKPMGFWTLAEGAVNLGLSIWWARRYGLIGVALGTAVPQIFIRIFLQPWYTLRALQIPVWDYLRGSIARPLAVGCVFVAACRLLPQAPVDSGIPGFLLSAGWQTILFGVVAYALGLDAADRGALRRRVRCLFGRPSAEHTACLPGQAPVRQEVSVL